MITYNKRKLLKLALRQRYAARQLEIAGDFAAAVATLNHYATTAGVAGVLAPRVQFQHSEWFTNYERVRRTLEQLKLYIFNKGTAGSSGNYWGLTQEGEELLKSHFEYQLLESIGGEQ